jgi:hypothetical protein
MGALGNRQIGAHGAEGLLIHQTVVAKIFLYDYVCRMLGCIVVRSRRHAHDLLAVFGSLACHKVVMLGLRRQPVPRAGA